MIVDLGLIDYREAYRIQKEFVAKRKLGEIEDSLIIAEHYPVFTIGRTGRIENLLKNEAELKEKGIEIISIDRGGDITFHGPGQLVLYPIIDLKGRDSDLHHYMRDLEEVVIKFLAGYSVSANRLPGKTGVWVGDKKIAFIGIAASNWIAFHGLSLNIDVDLKFFSMINPCGIKGMEVTSLAAVSGKCFEIDEVKGKILAHFNEVFNGSKLAAVA